MISIIFDQDSLAYLHAMAEKGQALLPMGFREYNFYAEECFANGTWPSDWNARATIESGGGRLAQAVLKELKILLCGDDPKYRDVVLSSRSFSQKATAAAGGYIAAAHGIEVALATSAVAASMLLVARVGREAFCSAFTAPSRRTTKRTP